MREGLALFFSVAVCLVRFSFLMLFVAIPSPLMLIEIFKKLH